MKATDKIVPDSMIVLRREPVPESVPVPFANWTNIAPGVDRVTYAAPWRIAPTFLAEALRLRFGMRPETLRIVAAPWVGLRDECRRDRKLQWLDGPCLDVFRGNSPHDLRLAAYLLSGQRDGTALLSVPARCSTAHSVLTWNGAQACEGTLGERALRCLTAAAAAAFGAGQRSDILLSVADFSLAEAVILVLARRALPDARLVAAHIAPPPASFRRLAQNLGLTWRQQILADAQPNFAELLDAEVVLDLAHAINRLSPLLPDALFSATILGNCPVGTCPTRDPPLSCRESTQTPL